MWKSGGLRAQSVQPRVTHSERESVARRAYMPLESPQRRLPERASAAAQQHDTWELDPDSLLLWLRLDCTGLWKLLDGTLLHFLGPNTDRRCGGHKDPLPVPQGTGLPAPPASVGERISHSLPARTLPIRAPMARSQSNPRSVSIRHTGISQAAHTMACWLCLSGRQESALRPRSRGTLGLHTHLGPAVSPV